jgi:hypothetical protein
MKNIMIFLVVFLFLSCSKERKILSDIRKNSVIDLANYTRTEFDYIVILNMGDLALKEYLKTYMIDISDLKPWLGEKILFICSNKIVVQYNLAYPVSEPNRDYISFFKNDDSDYFIFFKGNTKFSVEKAAFNLINQKYSWYYLHNLDKVSTCSKPGSGKPAGVGTAIPPRGEAAGRPLFRCGGAWRGAAFPGLPGKVRSAGAFWGAARKRL